MHFNSTLKYVVITFTNAMYMVLESNISFSIVLGDKFHLNCERSILMCTTPEEGLYSLYSITTIKISWKEQRETNCTLNKDREHIMFDLIHHRIFLRVFRIYFIDRSAYMRVMLENISNSQFLHRYDSFSFLITPSLGIGGI